MRLRGSWVFFIGLLLCTVALAAVPSHIRVPQPSAVTGMEPGAAQSVSLPRGRAHALDDTIVGSRYLVGTTWNDLQQNGSAGKQIAVDRDGWVHVVWTNGLNSANSPRHVYYNVWDPSTQEFISPTGYQANTGSRGGFVNVAVNDNGFGFPVFHQINNSQSIARSAAAIDFQSRLGALAAWEIPPMTGDTLIWPHADIDRNGVLHTVSTQQGGQSRHFYARGVPYFSVEGYGDSVNWPGGFQSPGELGTFPTADVAAAPHSDRIAMAWIYGNSSTLWVGDNIYYKISEDGGLNWGPTVNMTNFAVVDTNCIALGGDAATCDKDTLRPWIDLSMVFDDHDMLHIAFSTEGYYYWFPGDSTFAPGGWTFTGRFSQIWHWSEATDWFSLVADRWYGPEDPTAHTVSLNNLMVQRPSLAIDTTTGYLYCSYQAFDTAQWNNFTPNILMSDAYMTVSTDGGRRWAEGTDVTLTNGGQNTAPPNSKSERDIMLAKYVTGGNVHMTYEMDHDAGTAVFSTPGGVVTLNEIYYLRIPVDSIPTSPLMPVRALHWDSTGFPDTTLAVGNGHTAIPGEFTLYQNYPNPFNPTTTIQFDLMSQSTVSLKVFDVLGRQVATLLDQAKLGAGVQMVPFDASSLASGIYFYRLETPTVKQTRKMVLMK
ncbi:MAG TPA: T9SS type A sorting domain-containing protein [bacterium]|jgi:hypothetical protein